MKFEFTKDEINTLTAMIDLAVKAGGLQAAEAGLYFVNKFKTPLKETDDSTRTEQD